MKNPRITAIYESDIFYLYLYVHFGTGSDFIFKVNVQDEMFQLKNTIVYKLSNPFYGVTPVHFITPRCFHWCCITVSTYNQKSFLKFYEVDKEKLNNPIYKEFPIAQIKDPKKRSPNNVGTLSNEIAFHTLSLYNLTGVVEDITFDPTKDASSDEITCLVLKNNGEILNLTINRNFKIIINNLYLSSKNMKLKITGK